MPQFCQLYIVGADIIRPKSLSNPQRADNIRPYINRAGDNYALRILNYAISLLIFPTNKYIISLVKKTLYRKEEVN